jgi:DNA polymerase
VVIIKKLSPFQQHERKWENCNRCTLCKTRQHVVLARGKIPCDVLFVGEAPGQSEDVIGRPFIGPAGRLLDRVMAEALEDSDDLRCLFTNIVACIPITSKGKVEAPSDASIEACKPRLLELMNIAKPKVVIAVGGVAKNHLPPHNGYKLTQIVHPAAMLRMNMTQQAFAVFQSVNAICAALQEAGLD